MSEPQPDDSESESSESSESSETSPTGFAALGLRDELVTTTNSLGYEEPTPIQRLAIPEMLTGQDILGQAATGTGKTAAFALPILNGIEPNAAAIPTALVVVPTRELAVQVSEAMFKYGAEQRIQVVPIYGGQPIHRQLQALRRGVHVVVATPGRAIDHIRRGSLALDAIRTVVLDEADEMLDMGFTEDIETILETTPKDRQTVLFSATMPRRIMKIAEKYQRNPKQITVGAAESAADKALIRQTAYVVTRHHKSNALGRILDMEGPSSAIVFCRTRGEVDELTATMNGRGYRAEALHGGMDQQQRDRVMSRLRDGTAELLVATDVAARGLDVDTLTHVVNYDVPSSAESYVHRIGRVGRAGREGVAITLAEPKQRRLLNNIERLTKQTFDIQKVPTIGDLREKQITVTVEAIREAMMGDDLEDYNSVLYGLASEGSERNIALAAIKLFHQGRGATADEVEIPDASERMLRDDRPGKGKGKGKGNYDGDRGGKPGAGKGGKGGKGGKQVGNVGPGTALIFVGLGRKSGVRPGDLVGCIANETGLTGRDIGPIRITENYSVVGVPEASADTVISAIGATMIRGKKARSRRYVD
ncbi:MAG: DEAD/DEAH box helicase [Acidimicrobiales bacterium]|nr:DEAD/DEAH box helicase [Acidimicrobiales bacterium]